LHTYTTIKEQLIGTRRMIKSLSFFVAAGRYSHVSSMGDVHEHVQVMSPLFLCSLQCGPTQKVNPFWLLNNLC